MCPAPGNLTCEWTGSRDGSRLMKFPILGEQPSDPLRTRAGRALRQVEHDPLLGIGAEYVVVADHLDSPLAAQLLSLAI